MSTEEEGQVHEVRERAMAALLSQLLPLKMSLSALQRQLGPPSPFSKVPLLAPKGQEALWVLQDNV